MTNEHQVRRLASMLASVVRQASQPREQAFPLTRRIIETIGEPYPENDFQLKVG